MRPDCRQIFLDSDDLKDLKQLNKHVRNTQVLVLLQTPHVLHRPYCLLELLTAIDNVRTAARQHPPRPQERESLDVQNSPRHLLSLTLLARLLAPSGHAGRADCRGQPAGAAP